MPRLLLLAAAAALAHGRPVPDLAEAPAPAPSPGLVVIRSQDALARPASAETDPTSSPAWAALFRVASTAAGPEPGTTLLRGSWVDPSKPSAEPNAAATAVRATAAPGGPSTSPTQFQSFQLAGYYLPPGCLSSQVCGQPYGYYGGGYGYGGWVG